MEEHNVGAPPKPGKDRTILSVVLAGCGCLVLIAAVAILLFGKFIFAVRAPVDTVKAHLQAVNESDYQTAYLHLSETYRKAHSMEDFRASLRKVRHVFPYRSTSLNKVNVKNDTATVEGKITAQDGTVVPVWFELHHEKDRWKITAYRWTSSAEHVTI